MEPIQRLTGQELASFLTERGASQARIEHLEQCWKEEIEKELKKRGLRSDGAAIEINVSIQRAKFVQKLKGYDTAGMPPEDRLKIFGF